MSWQEITLGDAIHIKHGFAFKSKHFINDGKYIVLTPGNFHEEGGFRLRPDKDRAYDGDIPEGYILDEGDLIVAMTEQGAGLLGSSALIPEADRFLHNQRLGLIDQIDTNVLNKQFLYYLFNTHMVRGQISGSASGTKVRHTSPDKIYRVNVKVPTVFEQEKAVEILAAYDKHIENNQRRINLLERAARLFYREWFVHLRFPGYEHTKVTDGIPKGWSKIPLFEIAEPTYGFSFKSNYFNEDGFGLPVARIRDIPRGISNTYTSEDAPNEKLLSDGDFVIGMDGEFHMNFWIGGKTWINQRVVRISPFPGYSTGFLRYAVEDPIKFFNTTISGTTVAHLGAKHLKTINVLVPPDHLLLHANTVLDDIRNQIVLLGKQCRTLTEARNLLLPQLMKGELNI